MRTNHCTFILELDGTKPDFEFYKLLAVLNACEAFGIDRLDILDPGDVYRQIPANPRPFSVYVSSEHSLTEWLAGRDGTLVAVEERCSGLHARLGATSLGNIKHPDSAVYVFGRDGAPALPQSIEPDAILWIPSKRSVYSFTAASIVAAHRYHQLHAGGVPWSETTSRSPTT